MVGVGRRCRPITAFAVLAVLAAVPASASAQASATPIDDGPAGRFVIDPTIKWPSKTITYFSMAREYKDEVKRAAEAWNKSGANLKWKPVSRRRAGVQIKVSRSIAPYGLATHLGNGHALIEISPGIVNDFPEQEGRAAAARVLVHEMGHVVGLEHEDRKCTTMNSFLWGACNDPDEDWQYRCRLLERDDIKGASKIFGGKPKKLGPEFCALGEPPAAITDFSASWDEAESEVDLTWGLPSENPPKDLTIYRGELDGVCPDAEGKDSSEQFTTRAEDGELNVDALGLSIGGYCYTAVALNEYGRPGGAVTTNVLVAGNTPTAEFVYEQNEGTTTIQFYDDSTDNDFDIESWQWDFGDGSAVSTAQNPVHTYAPFGSHEVSLTVTDEGGNSDEISKTVSVANPEAPTVDFSYDGSNGTTVEFFDNSFDDGTVESWQWDFGDGSAVSTEQNPVHTYAELGEYEVTLTVTDNDGNVAESSQTITVAQGTPPIADFDYDRPTGTTIQFNDNSSDEDGFIVSWDWDFGDGSAGSTEAEPSHTYAASGDYDVTLTVTDNDGNSSTVEYSVSTD